MARLLLLRHGQSTWNAEGRWQGWADPPLSPLGEAQARAAALRLVDHGLEAVVSSDLERARQTAVILAAGLELGGVRCDQALRERDVGEWSSLTAEQIEERWPGALSRWREGRLRHPPGGEPDDAMATRVFTVLDKLAAREVAALLVVTHGGVIRLVERRLGVEPGRTSFLCGRWLEPGGTALVLGEEVVLPDLDDELTASR